MTAALIQPAGGFHLDNKPLNSQIRRSREEVSRHKVRVQYLREALDAAARAADLQIRLAGVGADTDRRLPPLVGELIRTQWRSYLMRVHMREGGESRGWNEAVQTMNDLKWSVETKKDAPSRRRLFALLPRLYQHLHVGLESLGMGEKDQDEFFAQLAKLNQAALYRQPSAG